MTDDELNAAVARIEGYTPQEHPGFPAGHYYWMHPERPGEIDPPPYATDWQWCGPLMERHEVVTSKYQGAWLASSQRVRASEDASLCRAICLAVIAAHEEAA